MDVNKIYNENCLATMERMPDEFVDLVITSPPYDGLRDYNGFHFDFNKTALSLLRIIKQGGVIVWVVGDENRNGSETGTSFEQALFFKSIGFNLHDTMIYYSDKQPFNHKRYEQAFEYMFVFSKGTPKTFNGIRERKMNKSQAHRKIRQRKENGEFKHNIRKETVDKLINNIWYYPTGQGASTTDLVAFGHPAIFPEQLAADHIYSWSNKGDLVYDPFIGSGTVAKMSFIHNRDWIGSEISPEYCAIAEKRIAPYLQQQKLFT